MITRDTSDVYARDVVAVLVALAFQVALLIARVVLEKNGVAATNGHVVALTVAGLAASYVTLAAAARGLARRLDGWQRVGAWIAVVGAIAVIGSIAVYEGLLHADPDSPRAMDLAIAIRIRGWSIAEAVMIVGFALAAGRVGGWLAPPTIGLALLCAQPGITRASWDIAPLLVLLVAKIALVVVIARTAEHNAAPPVPEPERALSGLRRCELAAWMWTVLTPTTAIAWWLRPTFAISVASACAVVLVNALFATSAWSNARAALPGFSRWPWFAAAMFTVWGVVRSTRSWALTFLRHWGDLDATPLTLPHWSVNLPGLFTALSALTMLAVFAHQTEARDVRRAAIVAATFSAIAFAVTCAMREHAAARAACFTVANLASALAYRIARTAIHSDVPRARVV